MENETIVIDTSILIDYYRRTDKKRAVWTFLAEQEYRFAISAITKYEIYSGASAQQLDFWDTILSKVQVLAVDEDVVDKAVEVNGILKKKRGQIDLADLLIASTAVRNGLSLATLNRKHFERIEQLTIVDV